MASTITVTYPNAGSDPLAAGIKVWVATSAAALTDAYLGATAPTVTVEGNVAVIAVDGAVGTYYVRIRAWSRLDGVLDSDPYPLVSGSALAVPLDVVTHTGLDVLIGGDNLLYNSLAREVYLGDSKRVAGWKTYDAVDLSANPLAAAVDLVAVTADQQIPGVSAQINAGAKSFPAGANLIGFVWQARVTPVVGGYVTISFSAKTSAAGLVANAFGGLGDSDGAVVPGYPTQVTDSWQRFAFRLPAGSSALPFCRFTKSAWSSQVGQVLVAAPQLEWSDQVSMYKTSDLLPASATYHSGLDDFTLAGGLYAPDNTSNYRPEHFSRGVITAVRSHFGLAATQSRLPGLVGHVTTNLSTGAGKKAALIYGAVRPAYAVGDGAAWDGLEQVAFMSDLDAYAPLDSPLFANVATVYGSATDGSDGVKVSSFKPALTLIDRTSGQASFRWVADGGHLRLEADNLDNGASWKVPQLLIDSEGRVTTGGGATSSAVGLYVRPTALNSATAYGVFSRPVFDPAVQTWGRVFYAGAENYSAGTLPRIDNYLAGIPTVDGSGRLTQLNHFVAAASSQPTIDEIRGFWGAVSDVAGLARWNLYCDGSAANYLAGDVLLGTTTRDGSNRLIVAGNGKVTGTLAAQFVDATLRHQSNYFDIHPYNATTYDNGRYARLYFAGYNNDGATSVNELRMQLDGGAALNLTVTGAVNCGTDYRVNGIRVVGPRKGGWAPATGTATRTAFATSTVTVSQLAERVKALIDDFYTTAGHGLLGA